MKNKLDNFKKEIRRNDINKYFKHRREEAISKQNQMSYTVFEKPEERRRIEVKSEFDSEIEQSSVDSNLSQKWTQIQTQIKAKLAHNEYQILLKIMKEIYHDLKKITKIEQLTYKFYHLLDQFLKKNILSSFVGCVLQAFYQRVNSGLMQQLSKKALAIVDLAIFHQPQNFKQGLIINSNLLPFFRCCLQEPKFDQGHLCKLMNILVHMIIVSTSQSCQLFNILNSRNSQFNFSSIFSNISRIPLRPKDQITQNFIIFMKFYLSRVQQDLLRARTIDEKSLPPTCLSPSQIDLSIEVVVNSVNATITQLGQDRENSSDLEEALQVTRILLQRFQIKQTFRNKLKYLQLIKLLHHKECIVEIKHKILVIIDHLIYEDQSGKMTEYLVFQGDLVCTLWLLREDFYGYVMNIFTNLVLNKDIKPQFSPYIHRIFCSIQYNRNDLLLYNFIYNWFSSQFFQILEAREKLLLQFLADSQQTNQKIINIQCLLWLRLVRNNQVTVPRRILNFDNEIVRQIRQQIRQRTEEEERI